MSEPAAAPAEEPIALEPIALEPVGDVSPPAGFEPAGAAPESPVVLEPAAVQEPTSSSRPSAGARPGTRRCRPRGQAEDGRTAPAAGHAAGRRPTTPEAGGRPRAKNGRHLPALLRARTTWGGRTTSRWTSTWRTRSRRPDLDQPAARGHHVRERQADGRGPEQPERDVREPDPGPSRPGPGAERERRGPGGDRSPEGRVRVVGWTSWETVSRGGEPIHKCSGPARSADRAGPVRSVRPVRITPSAAGPGRRRPASAATGVTASWSDAGGMTITGAGAVGVGRAGTAFGRARPGAARRSGRGRPAGRYWASGAGGRTGDGHRAVGRDRGRGRAEDRAAGGVLDDRAGGQRRLGRLDDALDLGPRHVPEHPVLDQRGPGRHPDGEALVVGRRPLQGVPGHRP